MKNELIRRNLPCVPILASIQERAVEPGSASSLHYHEEIEFIVVYEGIISCTAYGGVYEAKAGEVMFINSGVPHSTYRKTKNRVGLIQLREEDFSEPSSVALKYSERINPSNYTPVKVFTGREIFLAADELLCESEARCVGYGSFVRSSVYRLLGYLYRSGVLIDKERLYKTREIEKILPLLSYVNENYSKDISLDEASARLGFDPSYFCRIFKAATGATFTEYINFVRIMRAEELLSESGLGILEISEAVGFSSVSYFSRIFKRYKGCPPGVYRAARYSVE